MATATSLAEARIVSRSRTVRPERSTVTVSDTSKTSASLWEMKMTAAPEAARRRIVSKSDVRSERPRSEVGSSRMRQSAPR